MKRVILGWLFIIHALAHAGIGIWIAGDGPPFILQLFWTLALVGYMAAGLALLRVPVLRDHWKPILGVAAVSSILLCIAFAGLIGIVGVAVSGALLIVAADVLQGRIDADITKVDVAGTAVSRHPAWLRVGWSIGLVVLAYVAVVVLIRPIYLRWGTTMQERRGPLPGDAALRTEGRYRVDHAITIHAPASSVWPWLAQLGQDRGGFYSYDWLERAFGADIHNADRIHPEWQQRAVGDTVFATQRSYLGGKLGGVGWRVSEIVPGRAIVLENWGAFVLRPIDSTTTRLIVRTREAGTPGLAGLVMSPFGVFVFEPAHFIMQRSMLRGIRDRAEASVAQ